MAESASNGPSRTPACCWSPGCERIAYDHECPEHPRDCQCSCHEGDDHCALCTNDYADLCANKPTTGVTGEAS